jgi:hypothetical protein
MPFDKVTGVLMELNASEKQGLEDLLTTAENHLLDVRRDHLWEAMAMLDGLREVFDIPVYGQGQPEGRLEAVAQRASYKNLECQRPDCTTAIRATTGLEAWRTARGQGWKLAHPGSPNVILLYCPACSAELGMTR